MTKYKTVLDKQTGELKKVEISPKSDESTIDITDKDALRKLAIKTLVSVIQANPTALAVVPALKELFDRVDGKAPQSIVSTSTVENNMNFVIKFVGPDNKLIEYEG